MRAGRIAHCSTSTPCSRRVLCTTRHVLKEDIANSSLTARELAGALRKRLDAISICGAGGMDWGVRRSRKAYRAPGFSKDDDGGNDAPVTSGPLRDMLSNSDGDNGELVAAEEPSACGFRQVSATPVQSM